MQHPQFHAQKQPQKAACILANTGEVMTYAELDAQSNQLAQLFYSRGLRAGDHIAYQMENSHCFLQIAWAAQRSGLVTRTSSQGREALFDRGIHARE